MKLALLLVVGAAAYPDSSCTPTPGSPCENTFSGPGAAWEVASGWSEGHTPAAFQGWETVVSKSVVFDTVTGPAPHAALYQSVRCSPLAARAQRPGWLMVLGVWWHIFFELLFCLSLTSDELSIP